MYTCICRFDWFCKARCTHPCRWDTTLQKSPLLLLLLLLLFGFGWLVGVLFFYNETFVCDLCVCFVLCKFVSGLILCFLGEFVVWLLVCRVNRRQTEVCFNLDVNPFWLTWLKVTTNYYKETRVMNSRSYLMSCASVWGDLRGWLRIKHQESMNSTT